MKRVDVLRCWYDIVVTDQHHWGAARHEFGGVGNEALKPGQLVIEFQSRLRIPIGEEMEVIRTPWTAASM
jgi:hypothetical protein